VTFPLPANSSLVLSDGGQPQTIDVSGIANMAALKTAIEAVLGAAAGGHLVVDGSLPTLKITNTMLGVDSYVEIVGGTAVPFLDTGNTPAVTSEGTQSLNPNLPAKVEGTVAAATAQAAAAGQTLNVTIAGNPLVVLSLGTAGVDHTSVATFLSYLTGQLTGATATLGSGGGVLVTTTATGTAATITLADVSGGLAALGFTAGVTAGIDVFPVIGTQTFSVIVDGGTPAVVTLASETAFAAVKANIEGAVTGVTVTQGINGGAILTGTTTGIAGTLEIVEGTGGAALLGLPVGTVFAGNGEAVVAGAKVYGGAFAPAPGDHLYVDGAYVADISKVAPGGQVDVIRINKQLPIDSNIGTYFYIIARNLVAGDPANGVTRPYRRS